MRMAPTGNLINILALCGCLQRANRSIHLCFQDMTPLSLNILMMILWITTGCSKTNVVSLFLAMLDQTAEMAPPKKSIWVPRKTTDALPITSVLTMQAEKVRQNEYMHTSFNHYTHSSGKNLMPTPLIMLILLRVTIMVIERNHILLALLFRSHLQRCGWLRKPNFSVGLCLWVY